MNRRFFAIASTVLVLALGACGGQKDTGFNNLGSPKPTGGGGSGTGGIALVAGNRFDPVTFEAKVGAAVVWTNKDSSQPHNVVSDTDLFNSNPDCTLTDQSKCMPLNSTYTFTFKTAGEYKYYCLIHGTKGGVGMAGVVKVT